MNLFYFTMNLKPGLAALFWLFLLLLSCSRTDMEFDAPSMELGFSQDTIVLDTVFNQVRSETYALKIYNRESKNIRIPKIYLEDGANSLYKLNLDGKPGFEFSDVEIRAKDSLYVFVEIAPKANSSEFVAEERLFVETPLARQHVTLLSLVQDAEFYVSTEENPQIISQNTVWDNKKVKIVYGNLKVAPGSTLTVEEGTAVYFHKNSSLHILENAKLDVRGNLGKEVIFRGDRHDTRYDTMPMNWGGIRLEEGSLLNMNYTKISGGQTAVSMQKSKAEINNTLIYNFQEFGIYAVESEILAKNLIMNHFGQAAIWVYGGKYDFTHSTIANYWNISPTPALGIIASSQHEGKNSPVNFNLKNSIVYTQNINALQLSGIQNTYFIENSLVKYDAKNAGFAWDNNTNIVNSLKNTDPQFLNITVSKMNLRVKAESPARGKANSSTALLVPYDIAGTDRRILPTIGAYQ